VGVGAPGEGGRTKVIISTEEKKSGRASSAKKPNISSGLKVGARSKKGNPLRAMKLKVCENQSKEGQTTWCQKTTGSLSRILNVRETVKLG